MQNQSNSLSTFDTQLKTALKPSLNIRNYLYSAKTKTSFKKSCCVAIFCRLNHVNKVLVFWYLILLFSFEASNSEQPSVLQKLQPCTFLQKQPHFVAS